jgi:hypothetical protein
MEVFDNTDRCSVDIFVLRSAESGQMEYGVYDKYLMLKKVSFANGTAEVSFKDTIRKGCAFSYLVVKPSIRPRTAPELEQGLVFVSIIKFCLN